MKNKDDAPNEGSGDISTNHIVNEKNVEDLEDFGNKKESSMDRPRPLVRHYEGNSERHPVKSMCQADDHQEETRVINNGLQELSSLQQHAVSAENIDRNIDYQGWLELKKRKWKDALDKRKRQRYIFPYEISALYNA